MKKDFRLFSAATAGALILCLLTTACGGSSGAQGTDSGANYKNSYSASSAAYGAYDFYDDMDMDMAPEEAQAAPAETGPNTALTEEDSLLSERKIIRNAYMDLETKQFDQTITEFKELIASVGGYVQNESLNGQSITYRSDYYERYASITARVPAEKLDEVMNAVGGLFNVVSQNASMDDITDSYYDAQARLDSLNLQEERLLAILAQADQLEDVITLEQALSDVRYQIESITASLRRMDSQVAYSTLSVGISEVVEYQDIKIQPATFWDKLSEAGGNSMQKLSSTLQGILFFIVEEGPTLLVWLLFLLVLFLIVRKIVRVVARWRAQRPVSADRARKYQGKGAHYPAVGPTTEYTGSQPAQADAPAGENPAEKPADPPSGV